MNEFLKNQINARCLRFPGVRLVGVSLVEPFTVTVSCGGAEVKEALEAYLAKEWMGTYHAVVEPFLVYRIVSKDYVPSFS